ncbi:hypothetical protein NV379_19445 [Paenibacillus sp. N1-5-1-14]|uniref:hypothetical protein n=1 Tax=Paenibacillus radicibacter TaxID=2972488 RepID=UPI00215977E0|nr:hypothetical protein [Paenibacillus radicibacter]MCR8644831.1 hypothetical protein [Paenibacillus radicibacter]
MLPSKITLSAVDPTDLKQVSGHTDFKLFVPHYNKQHWKLEIKDPSPIDTSNPITLVRLHYFDPAGHDLWFRIEQHSAYDYNLKKTQISVDMSGTRDNKLDEYEEEFKFDDSGEAISINGVIARYTPGHNHSAGGHLRWIQDETYIDIDSSRLSKYDMIELAKTMQPTKNR